MSNPNEIVSQGLELDGTYSVIFAADMIETHLLYSQRVSIVEGIESAHPGKTVYTYYQSGPATIVSIGPRKRPNP